MELAIFSKKEQEILDITEKISVLVKDSEKKDGVCHIYCPHATAAITINENADPNVCLDILDSLNQIIPQGKWRHDRIDNNAAAHIKASIIGPSESIPFKDNQLQLGAWQDIFLCDFDGPKKRRIIVTLL